MAIAASDLKSYLIKQFYNFEQQIIKTKYAEGTGSTASGSTSFEVVSTTSRDLTLTAGKFYNFGTLTTGQTLKVTFGSSGIYAGSFVSNGSTPTWVGVTANNIKQPATYTSGTTYEFNMLNGILYVV